MTMFNDEKRKCVLCGTENNYSILRSTNSFGPFDLDFRPAPMERDTLSKQIQVCPKCGYSNYDIAVLEYPNAKEIVKSKNYQEVLNMVLPKTAKGFYLYSIIAEENKDYVVAGYALLRAAWYCDDRAEIEKAIEFRKKAITDYLKVLEEGKGEDEDKLLLVDLYRRTKQFDKALEYANKICFVKQDELFDEMKEYEIDLIKKSDSNCHNVGRLKAAIDIYD